MHIEDEGMKVPNIDNELKQAQIAHYNAQIRKLENDIAVNKKLLFIEAFKALIPSGLLVAIATYLLKYHFS